MVATFFYAPPWVPLAVIKIRKTFRKVPDIPPNEDVTDGRDLHRN
jgi:hypothetical protein